MQLKGNEDQTGNRLQQVPRWLTLKEFINNNRAQRGKVLSFTFDICHTGFVLLINTKHLPKDGAHSSKNLLQVLDIERLSINCVYGPKMHWIPGHYFLCCLHVHIAPLGPKDTIRRIQAWSLASMHLREGSSFSAQVPLSVVQGGAELHGMLIHLKYEFKLLYHIGSTIYLLYSLHYISHWK